ncbi:MAG: hypothetical protein Q7U48_13655 [Hydrogenophaga sp.]|nr:hypothetical protein [Hydrogenophaga sp.]
MSAEKPQIYLEPRPFCGSHLLQKVGRCNPSARCTTDGCKGKQLPVLNLDIQSDIDAWNTRAELAPEGCTPADARMLRKANHGLAMESHKLRAKADALIEENEALRKDAERVIESRGCYGWSVECDAEIDKLRARLDAAKEPT